MTAVDVGLDRLRPAVGGRWADELVVVEHGVRDGVLAVRRPDGRVQVRHRLRTVDDDLAETLAGALSPVTDSHEVFVRAFTGIVLGSRPDPLAAWEAFYRATLLRRGGYDAIYRHALELLPRGRILDLGCGFGFLALLLAQRGRAVVAADVEPGATRLLEAMAPRLGLELDVAGDTTALPDRCVDAVALVHVLEHCHDDTPLHEALRLARRTVVVAVPFEREPNPLYGHVRTFTSTSLAGLAPAGWTADVHEHHGGWLLLRRGADSHPVT